MSREHAAGGRPGPEARILARAELLDLYRRPRGQRVVFTNGCFDILHRGHVEYLYAARALGDALVVGVNTDDSVRRLKGPGRPVVALEDRMYVLAGLGCVDAVTPFDEDTPQALIADLLPDVLVKGGDYAPDQVVGAAAVEEAGGEVMILPFVEGRSTTEIIRRLKNRAET
ncbi:MAG: D-glycero-beta-D-manno-heptose 1-phosphate adenylyltransferase [Longimicrobiales bacterium]|nr:D-glycero-beta-D-manno-heptose 1-phosphate adenylyltransferase [Longimicrobiales bacterium]